MFRYFYTLILYIVYIFDFHIIKILMIEDNVDVILSDI